MYQNTFMHIFPNINVKTLRSNILEFHNQPTKVLEPPHYTQQVPKLLNIHRKGRILYSNNSKKVSSYKTFLATTISSLSLFFQ